MEKETMKRITERPILLIAVIAVAVVGAAVVLGGGDDDGSEQASGEAASPSAIPEAVKEKAEKAAAPAEEATKELAESAPETASGEASEESDDDGEISRDEAREQLKKTIPLAQRQQFVQTAATGVMTAFGYSTPTAKINKRDVVTVLTPPGGSCAVELAGIPEVKKKLFETILFARRIRLQVFGHGGLNGYVSENCRPLEVPNAPGPVVWSESGTGLKSSPELVINSPRFTVAWANNGGNLEIYVTRGQTLIEPVIKSRNRETGTQTYLGPGTFKVTVAGSGSWGVKVYDGA
jgi:hypothetical protein